jgi:hypothetical protein
VSISFAAYVLSTAYAAQQSSFGADGDGDAEARPKTLRFGVSAVVAGGGAAELARAADTIDTPPGASGAFVRGVRDKIFGFSAAPAHMGYFTRHAASGCWSRC